MKSIRSGLIALAVVGSMTVSATAQDMTQDSVGPLSENLKKSMAELKLYEWVETSIISVGGEEKARKQNRCYYDAEGKLQKVATGGSEDKSKRGLRGKAAAGKKEAIATSMEQAVALVQSYLPPEPARIEAAKGAGKLSIRPADSTGRAGLDIKDYKKPGDQVTIEMDAKTSRILKVMVSSYTTAKDKDAVDFSTDFKDLPDGTTYPSVTTFNLKSEGATVRVENTGYKKM